MSSTFPAPTTKQPVSRHQALTALTAAMRIAAILVGLLVGMRATWQMVEFTDFPVDMVVYREGVQAFMQGRPVYSVPVDIGDLLLPFIYPPFGALAMVPLAGDWFNHDDAGNIMIIVSNALLGVCMWCGARFLNHNARRSLPTLEYSALVALAWGIMCWSEPVRLNNGFGQVNMVILALVALDLIPRKRWLPQGTLIGIAAAIKITPLAMLLFFALRRQIKPIVWAVTTTLAATLVAAAVRWDAAWEFFTVKLLAMGSGQDFGVSKAYQSNSSITGFLLRAYPNEESMNAHTSLTNILWLALSVTVVVAGAWIMRRLLSAHWVLDAVVVNAFIMLLVSPISWSHHWVWLALVLPLLLYRGLTMWNRHWSAPVLTLLTAVWTYFVLDVPPKWFFGDDVNLWALSWPQKIFISDYIWFALISAALLAVLSNFAKQNSNSPRLDGITASVES
ncbi:MAG: glycosyltransferase family 87 protein [Corynebacterium sp.]|nr:glycosyltransferase family 87 protein [Corynebacterium sp.]